MSHDQISFSPPRQRALDARYAAQRIAFGPVVFQCVRYAWKKGILAAVAEAGEAGISVEALAATGRWRPYAIKVALESCLSAGVVQRRGDCYLLDKTGYCVLSDSMTQVNMDFIHDVCYLGLADLEASLDAERPLGLRALGDWETLYEGLADLPEPARTSWFAFDHLYSDTSFPLVLPDVLATQPVKVMDIGANTGKFAALLLASAPQVQMHLVDLPIQLRVAAAALADAGLTDRAHLHGRDLLDAATTLPGGMDLVWMSQFLSCFGEEAIARIFRHASDALAPQGQVLVLDTLWDAAPYDIARYCLINTSPYFSAMASGNSKIYEGRDYIALAEAAGLKLVARRDGIGYGHSLLRFARATP